MMRRSWTSLREDRRKLVGVDGRGFTRQGSSHLQAIVVFVLVGLGRRRCFVSRRLRWLRFIILSAAKGAEECSGGFVGGRFRRRFNPLLLVAFFRVFVGGRASKIFETMGVSMSCAEQRTSTGSALAEFDATGSATTVIDTEIRTRLRRARTPFRLAAAAATVRCAPIAAVNGGLRAAILATSLATPRVLRKRSGRARPCCNLDADIASRHRA